MTIYRPPNGKLVVYMWALITLTALILALSACTPLSQRQAAYNGLQTAILAFELSARAYQRCAETERTDCAEDHQKRVEILDKADPFIRGGYSAAMLAPEQPADDNLARARQIMAQITGALLAGATGAERKQLEWLQ